MWPESGVYAARTDVEPPLGSPPIGKVKVLPIAYDYLEANTAAVRKRFSEILGARRSRRRRETCWAATPL